MEVSAGTLIRDVLGVGRCGDDYIINHNHLGSSHLGQDCKTQAVSSAFFRQLCKRRKGTVALLASTFGNFDEDGNLDNEELRPLIQSLPNSSYSNLFNIGTVLGSLKITGRGPIQLHPALTDPDAAGPLPFNSLFAYAPPEPIPQVASRNPHAAAVQGSPPAAATPPPLTASALLADQALLHLACDPEVAPEGGDDRRESDAESSEDEEGDGSARPLAAAAMITHRPAAATDQGRAAPKATVFDPLSLVPWDDPAMWDDRSKMGTHKIHPEPRLARSKPSIRRRPTGPALRGRCRRRPDHGAQQPQETHLSHLLTADWLRDVQWDTARARARAEAAGATTTTGGHPAAGGWAGAPSAPVPLLLDLNDVALLVEEVASSVPPPPPIPVRPPAALSLAAPAAPAPAGADEEEIDERDPQLRKGIGDVLGMQEEEEPPPPEPEEGAEGPTPSLEAVPPAATPIPGGAAPAASLLEPLTSIALWAAPQQQQTSQAGMQVAKKRFTMVVDEELDDEESPPLPVAPPPNTPDVKIIENRPMVVHSRPAVHLLSLKTELTQVDKMLWHRPQMREPPKAPLMVTFLAPELRPPWLEARSNKARRNAAVTTITAAGAADEPAPAPLPPSDEEVEAIRPLEVFKHTRDLTANDGRVVLMEYLEEYPLLLSGCGMATRVRYYYRKFNEKDAYKPKFADGDTAILELGDQSPFLGDVDQGSAVGSIENNLFLAPMFAHDPRPTDFLCTIPRAAATTGPFTCTIRKIDNCFAVGQQQPKVVVPAVQSQQHQEYLNDRLTVFITRHFKHKKNAGRIRIGQVTSAFQSLTESKIRKRLKDWAHYVRGGQGYWEVNDMDKLFTEDKLQELMTPERVCRIESMLAGFSRARKTSNTIPSDDPNAQAITIQLVGPGDPIGRNAGFSYLKQAPRANSRVEDRTSVIPRTVGGAGDLRRLSMDEMRQILLNLGEPDSRIASLSRWDRVKLLRHIATDQYESGEATSDLSKYARGSKLTGEEQRWMHQAQREVIFQEQMQVLSAQKTLELQRERRAQRTKKLQKKQRRRPPPATATATATATTPAGGPTPTGTETAAAGAEGEGEAEADEPSDDEDEDELSDEDEGDDELDEFQQELARHLAATADAAQNAPSTAEKKDREDYLALLQDFDGAAPKSPAPAATTPANAGPAAAAAAAAGGPPVAPGLEGAVVLGFVPYAAVPPPPTTGAADAAATAPGEAGTGPDGTPAQPPEGPGLLMGSSQWSADGANFPRPAGRKKRMIIKRTSTELLPNGDKKVTVTYQRDPRLINAFLNILRQSESRRRNGPAALTPEDELKKQEMKKTRRKLLEKLRRTRKTNAKLGEERAALEKYIPLTSGTAAIQDPAAILEAVPELKEKKLVRGIVKLAKSQCKLRCTACGQVGHIKTNRACPMYREHDKDQPTAAEAGLVKHGATALSLVIDNKKIEEKRREELKVKIKPKRHLPASTPPALAKKPLVPVVRKSRRTSAHVDLNSAILKFLEGDLWKQPYAQPFHAPVQPKVPHTRTPRPTRHVRHPHPIPPAARLIFFISSPPPRSVPLAAPLGQDAPDYRDVIAEPMDLGLVRSRLRDSFYRSFAGFLADIRLLCANAHTYNDKKPANQHIPPQADQVLKLCMDEYAKNETQYKPLEDAIAEQTARDEKEKEDQGHPGAAAGPASSPLPRKIKRPPGAKPGSLAARAKPTAPVAPILSAQEGMMQLGLEHIDHGGDAATATGAAEETDEAAGDEAGDEEDSMMTWEEGGEEALPPAAATATALPGAAGARPGLMVRDDDNEDSDTGAGAGAAGGSAAPGEAGEEGDEDDLQDFADPSLAALGAPAAPGQQPQPAAGEPLGDEEETPEETEALARELARYEKRLDALGAREEDRPMHGLAPLPPAGRPPTHAAGWDEEARSFMVEPPPQYREATATPTARPPAAALPPLKAIPARRTPSRTASPAPSPGPGASRGRKHPRASSPPTAAPEAGPAAPQQQPAPVPHPHHHRHKAAHAAPLLAAAVAGEPQKGGAAAAAVGAAVGGPDDLLLDMGYEPISPPTAAPAPARAAPYHSAAVAAPAAPPPASTGLKLRIKVSRTTTTPATTPSAPLPPPSPPAVEAAASLAASSPPAPAAPLLGLSLDPKARRSSTGGPQATSALSPPAPARQTQPLPPPPPPPPPPVAQQPQPQPSVMPMLPPVEPNEDGADEDLLIDIEGDSPSVPLSQSPPPLPRDPSAAAAPPPYLPAASSSLFLPPAGPPATATPPAVAALPFAPPADAAAAAPRLMLKIRRPVGGEGGGDEHRHKHKHRHRDGGPA
ncbi:putative Transcription initiation factor TFIID subunit 1 [Paratrimastix pyriformis]|uniref:Transcription initiation factor TFIID subunit 1 n=1 Tax=Paratrimastix pyriformis TaxID=342808 RepID=A0ABQ8UT12_9EUKA|nr:putative Transcription initiation factor TFIID subunit 1 [Paratrimastix pyriformis]